MDTTQINIIHFYFSPAKGAFIFEANQWIIIGVILLTAALFFLFKIRKWRQYIIPEFEVELSSMPKLKYKVKRSTENLFIANRIYIELVTRKAAIPIDEDNDTLVEGYNSLYKLFGIIRDEIKNVPGDYLKSHDPTDELIGLTTNILNLGLRPHLTKYQARFRRWYEKEIKDPKNEDRSPQEIQKEYPEYKELIADMKNLNEILKQYSEQLYKIIKGK